MKKLLPFIALAIAACTTAPGLIPGQSTLADIEAKLGRPAEKSVHGDETVYFYPQLPWGHASYAARIGTDGRLIALEQRLTEANIGKLVRDKTTIVEVRDLLGPPYQPVLQARMERVIWTYPMRIASDPTPKWFIAQFSSSDGVLRETYLMDDPHFVPKDTPRQHR